MHIIDTNCLLSTCMRHKVNIFVLRIILVGIWNNFLRPMILCLHVWYSLSMCCVETIAVNINTNDIFSIRGEGCKGSGLIEPLAS